MQITFTDKEMDAFVAKVVEQVAMPKEESDRMNEVLLNFVRNSRLDDIGGLPLWAKDFVELVRRAQGKRVDWRALL